MSYDKYLIIISGSEMVNMEEFDWSDEIKENDDILFPCDTLNRSEYAHFLTNFLLNDGMNKGYVLNINAPWGTGKTYFLRRWLKTLEKRKYPTVYIDAWKQDFSNDPMLAIVASIDSQLRMLLPNEVTDKEKRQTNTKRWKGFLKGAAPLVGKGLVKKALSIDLFELSELWEDEKDVSDESNDESLLSKDTKKSISAAAEKKIKELVSDHNATNNTIDDFKNAMKELVEGVVAEAELNSPTFIFIDELDRCRPTYAVEMLEVIKHFFEVKGIIFVVATDTAQLQHAVRAVYGQGFEAQTYLRRFFNQQCSLPTTDLQEFILNCITTHHPKLISMLTTISVVPSIEEPKHLMALFLQFQKIFNLSLRDLEQLIVRVSLISYTYHSGINLFLLLYFLIIKEKNNKIYNALIKQASKPNLESDFFDLPIFDEMNNENLYLIIEKNYCTPTVQVSNDAIFKLKSMIVPSYKCAFVNKSHSEKQAYKYNITTGDNLIQQFIVNDDTDLSTYIDLVELAISFN